MSVLELWRPSATTSQLSSWRRGSTSDSLPTGQTRASPAASIAPERASTAPSAEGPFAAVAPVVMSGREARPAVADVDDAAGGLQELGLLRARARLAARAAVRIAVAAHRTGQQLRPLGVARGETRRHVVDRGRRVAAVPHDQRRAVEG